MGGEPASANTARFDVMRNSNIVTQSQKSPLHSEVLVRSEDAIDGLVEQLAHLVRVRGVRATVGLGLVRVPLTLTLTHRANEGGRRAVGRGQVVVGALDEERPRSAARGVRSGDEAA